MLETHVQRNSTLHTCARGADEVDGAELESEANMTFATNQNMRTTANQLDRHPYSNKTVAKHSLWTIAGKLCLQVAVELHNRGLHQEI